MKRIVLTAAFLLITACAAFGANADDGEALFKARCNLCHQYPDRDMLRPEQWRRILDVKQELMEKAGMPRLTPEEYERLFRYLTEAKQ